MHPLPPQAGLTMLGDGAAFLAYEVFQLTIDVIALAREICEHAWYKTIELPCKSLCLSKTVTQCPGPSLLTAGLVPCQLAGLLALALVLPTSPAPNASSVAPIATAHFIRRIIAPLADGVMQYTLACALEYVKRKYEHFRAPKTLLWVRLPKFMATQSGVAG